MLDEHIHIKNLNPGHTPPQGRLSVPLVLISTC
jgi:hypothetical protein